MGQNPYCSIVSAKIWCCHCDVVFDCIVMNFFTNSPWYNLTPCKNLSRLNVIFMVKKIGQFFKILIIPSFWLILMTSLWCCLWLYCEEFFFTTSPWYYLTPYQNLLRLNVIFMVRKIGKKESRGDGCHPPEPSFCLILEPKWLVRSEKFFHGQMPQGW